MKKVILSFDDGSVEDEKLVDILHQYGYTCTLFVPKNNREGRKTISKSLLRDLSAHVEIGSHTLNHTYLTNIPFESAIEEVWAGHDYIEDAIGKRSNKFCYPGGKYTGELDDKIKTKIKYRRTIENFRFSVVDETLMPTFLQFYPHDRVTYFRNIIRNMAFSKIRFLGKPNFKQILKKNIQKASDNHVFHIWGHSWEIEEQDLWSDFIDFLNFCKGQNIFVCAIGDVYK